MVGERISNGVEERGVFGHMQRQEAGVAGRRGDVDKLRQLKSRTWEGQCRGNGGSVVISTYLRFARGGW
jgi:hypothetical protein